MLIFSFGGSDQQNMSSARLDITIKMCDCSGNGECQFEYIQMGQVFNRHFQLVKCECTPGWIGKINLNGKSVALHAIVLKSLIAEHN